MKTLQKYLLKKWRGGPSLYRVLLWSALLASLGLLWRLNAILVKPEYIPVDDFVRYWAAGRLLSGGQNPFDPALVYQMQVSAGAQGMDAEVVPLVFNPPWVLPILAPFGLLEYPLSRLLWLLSSVAWLMISAELAWVVYGGAVESRWIAWLVVFTFGPTISALEKGQITPLILLGAVGFLYCLSRRRYLLAGLCIALVSIKPQLFYLFWPALALALFFPGPLRLERDNRAAWRLMAGAAAAIFSGALLAAAIHPPVFGDFFYTLRHAPPSDWATPTFGSYLRLFVFGLEAFWVQFLPVLFGLAWLAVYAWRHRRDWDWLAATPWLALVSLLLAAYAWTYDQVLLAIPALQVAAWLSKPATGNPGAPPSLRPGDNRPPPGLIPDTLHAPPGLRPGDSSAPPSLIPDTLHAPPSLRPGDNRPPPGLIPDTLHAPPGLRPSAPWLLVILFTAINLLDLFLHRELDEFWFLWLAPAYLLCYLLARHFHKTKIPPPT